MCMRFNNQRPQKYYILISSTKINCWNSLNLLNKFLFQNPLHMLNISYILVYILNEKHSSSNMTSFLLTDNRLLKATSIQSYLDSYFNFFNIFYKISIYNSDYDCNFILVGLSLFSQSVGEKYK